MAKKSAPIQASSEQVMAAVDAKALMTATAEKMQSIIVSAGIDPVTTVGMQEVKIIRETFDKHLAALEALFPACNAVSPKDAVTAKMLALKVMRIRTAAEKDRLELNKESRARIAAVDGTNKVLLHVLTPVEAHLNKIVDDAAAAERQVIEHRAKCRLAEVQQYTHNVEGYDFLTMSEEMFQRLILRLQDEKRAAEQAEAARQAAVAEAEKAVKDAAEARRALEAKEAQARAIAEAKAREEAAAAEAKARAEEAAAKAAAEKACIEARRIQQIQCRLTEIKDMTLHTVTASSGEALSRMAHRLTELEGQPWDEMDMEAEGRIAMARAWLAGAQAKAAELQQQEADRIAAEAKALALAKGSDGMLLAELVTALDDFISRTQTVRSTLKLSENQHLVASLMSGIETHRQMIVARAARGAEAW